MAIPCGLLNFLLRVSEMRPRCLGSFSSGPYWHRVYFSPISAPVSRSRPSVSCIAGGFGYFYVMQLFLLVMRGFSVSLRIRYSDIRY